MRRLTNFSFGGTSAITTNLGLIIGLSASANAKQAIIGGILVIAIADNISDSLGIHIYQESDLHSTQESFFSTLTNYFTRLVISLTFVLLILLLPLKLATAISLIWGLLLLSLLSYSISRQRGVSPYTEMIKHLGIAVMVIITSRFIGGLIRGRL